MAEGAAGAIGPIVVDLGRTKRKAIKSLKRGRGKLMAEVDEALATVAANLGSEAQGKELIPVVLVYRKRDKKRRGRWPLGL